MAPASAAFNIAATIDRNQATLGEQFVVSVQVVSDREIPGIAAPALPAADWYSLSRVEKNQQSSSQIQVINGQMTRTTSMIYLFHFIVALRKEGSFTFPAIPFTAEGQTKTTQPFTLTVGKASAEEQGMISIAASVNKSRLYTGEQGVLTVRIAKKSGAPVGFNGEGFNKAIATIIETFGHDFAVSRLFTDKITQSTATVNGVPYEQFSLSFAITPLKDGTFTLPSIPFSYEMYRQSQRRQARDPFGDFFGGDPFFGGAQVERIAKTTGTNTLTITAINPPSPPADFSGAVGSFSLAAVVNTTNTSTGQGVTLTLTHAGTARPGTLADIALPQSSDLEVYTPEKTARVDTTTSGIRTTKVSKYLVVPRREGTITIPALSFCYFDPQSASYRRAETKPIDLTVTRGTGSAAPSGAMVGAMPQNDLRQFASDIRWIHTPAHLRRADSRPWRQPLLLFTLLLSLLVTVGAALLKTIRWLAAKDPAGQKRRRAHGRTLSALTHADAQHDAALAASAFTRYLSDALGFAALGETIDGLAASLARKKIPPATVETVTALMQEYDSLRFSGRSKDPASVSAIIKKTASAVNTLEKERSGA